MCPILGVGTDLLDVARMRRELEKEGGGLRDEVFTEAEISYCSAKGHPARHFAARFAAKEAFAKALQESAPPFAWREIEVESSGSGVPRLRLHGRARQAAERLGVRRVLVSLSHTDSLATATVVLEGSDA